MSDTADLGNFAHRLFTWQPLSSSLLCPFGIHASLFHPQRDESQSWKANGFSEIGSVYINDFYILINSQPISS